MIELDLDEREALRRYLLREQRMSGVNTEEYHVCKRLLKKLSDAKVIARPAPDAREQAQRTN